MREREAVASSRGKPHAVARRGRRRRARALSTPTNQPHKTHTPPPNTQKTTTNKQTTKKQIEGRGNGIKTNVVNNAEVAKALDRPPEYILKFYGCELGAQTNYDKGSGTSIVNGAHDTRKLAELLEAFIKKYVQCYSCGNPETTVKIKKDFIYLKCKACGYVSDVDMRHKLNTFILKNPPENKLSKEEKRQAAGRLAGEVGLRRSVDERLAQGRGVAAGRRPHLILVAGNSHPPSGVAAVQWHAMR